MTHPSSQSQRPPARVVASCVAIAAVVLTAACGMPVDTGAEGGGSSPTPAPEPTPAASSDPTTPPADPSDPVAPADDQPPSSTPTVPPVPTTEAPDADGGPTPADHHDPAVAQRLADVAVADLQARIGASADAIDIVFATAVVFPNGAMGCPRDDQMVTQALVPGYAIALQHEQRYWLYTSDEAGPPTLCESDEPDGGIGQVPPPGFDR